MLQPSLLRVLLLTRSLNDVKRLNRKDPCFPICYIFTSYSEKSTAYKENDYKPQNIQAIFTAQLLQFS